MLKIVLLVLIVVIVIFVAPRLFSGSRATRRMPGDIAPDFTLPSQAGAAVSLKDFRGKWVVLYFYPKDQTPGCTREAHN
ncbi:MAG: peroxiredoxin, partial [Candidatus Sulfotelmatobacter sp.]